MNHPHPELIERVAEMIWRWDFKGFKVGGKWEKQVNKTIYRTLAKSIVNLVRETNLKPYKSRKDVREVNLVKESKIKSTTRQQLSEKL